MAWTPKIYMTDSSQRNTAHNFVIIISSLIPFKVKYTVNIE